VDGNLVAVGDAFDDSDAEDAGAAYVFQRGPNGPVVREARLVPDEVGENDEFGFSVDLADGRLVVGAIDHELEDGARPARRSCSTAPPPPSGNTPERWPPREPRTGPCSTEPRSPTGKRS
jgi:hypothetical protein